MEVSGFYYLATPYSNYRVGLEEAHRQAVLAVLECLNEGLLVYSPIAHTHLACKIGGLRTDYGFWWIYNEVMMKASIGIIVVKIEGWDLSKGVNAEIKWCEQNNKPIFYRDPPK